MATALAMIVAQAFAARVFRWKAARLLGVGAVTAVIAMLIYTLVTTCSAIFATLILLGVPGSVSGGNNPACNSLFGCGSCMESFGKSVIAAALPSGRQAGRPCAHTKRRFTVRSTVACLAFINERQQYNC
ncbi:hypothetical protein CEJ86_31820 [Sinorhizobium meliloti]|uniref:Uncharacterized protein n=1 Tax=Rhizobium meliloti TaxID=382 RepID=A0A2J0YTD2_RHIML|nr:hypothetical protein CEJ86_31820 [Sinorhizobium meliloti]